MDRFRKVRVVHVGNEAEGQVALAVMPQRLVGHDRPQVRAANADIDHVANALAGMPLPLAAADAIGKCGHPVEHGMDLGHHVLAVDKNLRPLRRAQRHVQHRPPFGEVDLVAAKHGIDPRLQTRLLRQFDQQLDGLVGNAILRVVEEQAHGLNGHFRAALRVCREQIAQMHPTYLLMVSFELLPGLQLSQRLGSLAVSNLGNRYRHLYFPRVFR